jgi:DtxR family Mn-dependent transcriptional regulator
LENYLEAIYHIVDEKQAARAKDIALRLQVKASSVTGALRLLAERGLVNYAPYDVITLTPKGKKIAKDIVFRHQALRDFFIKVLAVDERIADETACKMEHVIPRDIVDRLVKFVDFADSCPQCGERWVSRFDSFCENGSMAEGLGESKTNGRPGDRGANKIPAA